MIDDDDDELKDRRPGYKNPPKEHQFRTGTSGNPAGRPRKKKTALGIDDILMEPVPGKLNGKRISMSIREYYYRQKIKKALEGDKAAMKALDKYLFGQKKLQEEDDEPLQPVLVVRPRIVDARIRPRTEEGNYENEDKDKDGMDPDEDN